MSAFQSTLPLRGATTAQTHARSTIPFQSTLPLRGATLSFRPAEPPVFISIHAPLAGSDRIRGDRATMLVISIHAPLAGSDSDCLLPSPLPSHFNPRSPCGERRTPSCPVAWIGLFQSTLPLRGATMLTTTEAATRLFQSTLPLRGATA